MVQFEDVDDETRKIIESRNSRQGSITKPIVDDFIKSGKDMVKVPFEESGSKSVMSLYLSLKSHMKTREDVDIDVFMHQGDIYLRRNDLDGQTS